MNDEEIESLKKLLNIEDFKTLKEALKNAIKFERTPAKKGETKGGKDCYVFNIIQIYIDNNLIDPKEDYIVLLLKIKKENNR